VTEDVRTHRREPARRGEHHDPSERETRRQVSPQLLQPAVELHAHGARGTFHLVRDLLGSLPFGQVDSQHLTVGIRHALERALERRHELSQLAVVRGILASALREPLRIRRAAG